MDIDMPGRTSNEEADIVAQIRDILTKNVATDGLAFDIGSIQAERIVVYPDPEESDLPTLLDFPPPRLLCYSRESSISEKFEAMVKLGVLNSRMKDFYDIWLLSRQFDFDGAKLTEAIRLTFEQRYT